MGLCAGKSASDAVRVMAVVGVEGPALLRALMGGLVTYRALPDSLDLRRRVRILGCLDACCGRNITWLS